MKKLLLSTCFALFCISGINAQLVTNSFPPPQSPYAINEAINALATDPQSNLFVAGNQLAPNANQMADTPNVLLQKYGPNDNLLWVAKAYRYWNFSSSPVPAAPHGLDVCTDASGNSYLLGRFHDDTLHLAGSAPLATTVGAKLFLAKYSPAGAVLWVRSINGDSSITGGMVKSDAAGNIYVAGRSMGTTANLGNGLSVVSSAAEPFSFIAKYTSGGTALWGTALNMTLVDMGVSAAGEVAFSGTAAQNLVVGGTTYNNTQNRFVLAKLNGSGAPAWVKNSVTEAGATGGLTIDAAGAIFVAGFYTIPLQIENLTLPLMPTYPNTTSTSFVAKYSASGALEWARPLPEMLGANVGFMADIAADNGGSCLLSGGLSNPGISAGQGNSADVYLAKVNAAGDLLWYIEGGSDSHHDFLGELEVNSQGQGYVTAGVMDHTGLMSPVPFSLGGHQTTVLAKYLDLTSTKIFKLNNMPVNSVSGRVFYDHNTNGTKDPNEAFVPGQVIQTQPSGIYTSASSGSGRYLALVGTGNHTISLPSPPQYYTVAPASHTVSFSNLNNIDTTRHFALQPIPNMQDLDVTITYFTPPIPGFDFPLQLSYRNVGTTTLSGSVMLELDPLVNYLNSSVAPASQSVNTLTWNFTNLQPTQSAVIIINSNVPATVALGDTLHHLATISPTAGDLTPSNNTYALSPIVVGSFDPNDKLVNHTSLTPTQVQNGEWLEYTIRFQNTGTYPAFTVKITDTLSTLLNISSVEVLASSHPHTWSIKGTGIIEFRFDNIMLPDSNTNEPASHGFVKYRIKPKTTLALGDVVENTAYIYFDFNAPIVTNTATTEVSFVNSVATLERNPLHIYPNPSKGTFTLQCSNILSSQVQAVMCNVLGQVVWQQNLSVENGKLQQVIRTSNLSKGVYYLQVKTDKGSKVQKVVLE